ncbi:unnamed protein product [Pseudo-nitzschia multistriata]|uniref:Glycosyltransferase family 92 protein n=1 Tax=Pseudo-nitzschia multistriata TaxID=183589 RepID=A0A448Z2U6_9STRA|nr:unnamed protein product [Pseudo-nitzschia multistriata]
MNRVLGVSPTMGTPNRDQQKRRKRHHNMLLRYFFFAVIVTRVLFLAFTQPLKVATDQRLESVWEGFPEVKTSTSPDIKEGAASALDGNKLLTAYLEPTESVTYTDKNQKLFVRNTSMSSLQLVTFPNVNNCSSLMKNFPVDEFPLGDPWLPWIHDYFPSLDGKSLHFVAQNRRRCQTGAANEKQMEFWAPQISLFQGIPIVVEDRNDTKNTPGGTRKKKQKTYRLASSFEEATHNATRFQCRFHHVGTKITTLSVFPFDYEYISWRKHKKAMIGPHGGKEQSMVWLSQLLFACPIPEEFQPLLLPPLTIESSKKQSAVNNDQPALYVDLIPIRTPVRSNDELLSDKLSAMRDIAIGSPYLNDVFGQHNIIPSMDNAGRWENLPLCRRSSSLHLSPIKSPMQLSTIGAKERNQKPHRLVACTWVSASYQRRGDIYTVSDSAKRLREWIHFHLMVGMDHIYVYDNTNRALSGNSSVIYDVTRSFRPDQVTYKAWPCKICNNNKPGNPSPGERSSQYAAESSCLKRYGELSEWMTFLDIDEYLVPMKQTEDGEYSWHPVMDEMDKLDKSVMKFLSSRGKPRIELTEKLEDQSVCIDPEEIERKRRGLPVEPCVGPMRNKTFLQVHNCDFIRPPKPQRFQRAMKQIYRPSFVLLHFVHYSTVTTAMTQYTNTKLDQRNSWGRLKKQEAKHELFMDELTQGALVHARSVLPHETRRRSAECLLGSKHDCTMGFLCNDDVQFFDKLHRDNVFQNPDKSFCNCWRNKVIEEVLVPKLERLLSIGPQEL